MLLLIANIVFMLGQWGREEPVASVPEAPAGQGGLRLLAEKEATADSRCFELGPVVEPEQLARIRAVLGRERLKPKESLQSELVPLGYWVYLPPAHSRAEAQALGRRLAAAGISDFVYVVGAEKQNAISLGLYKDQPAAEARADQVRTLGLEARVEDRYTRREAVTFAVRAPTAPPRAIGEAWREVDCQALGD